MGEKSLGKQLIKIKVDVVLRSWKYRKRKQSQTRGASVIATWKRKSFNPEGTLCPVGRFVNLWRDNLRATYAPLSLWSVTAILGNITRVSPCRTCQWNEKYVGRNLRYNLMHVSGLIVRQVQRIRKKIMRKLMHFSLHPRDV